MKSFRVLDIHLMASYSREKQKLCVTFVPQLHKPHAQLTVAQQC